MILKVMGPLRFLEQEPGTIFETDLDPGMLERAVARGAVEVLDSSRTRLQPGSFTLPSSWGPLSTVRRENE